MSTPDRRLWVSLLAALSLANLYMTAVWDEFHDHSFDYFRDIPYQTWGVFSRAVLDLVLLAIVFGALIVAAERLRNPLLRKGVCVLLLGVFAVGVDVFRIRGLHFYGASLLKAVGRSGLSILAGLVVLAIAYLLLFRDRTLTRAVRSTLTILLAAVPINLASTAWAIHSTWAPERYLAKPSPALLPTPARAPRVVWVIFDMWDYDLSFPQRRPDLVLPEVDRLQQETLHAENAVPPASQTLESIPSLTLGKIVATAVHRSPDELYLKFRGSSEQVSWSTQRNIFQDAREDGINSAVIGFYHPYPRVLGSSLAASYYLPFLTLHQTPLYWKDVNGAQRLWLEAEEALCRPPLLRNLAGLSQRREKRIVSLLYRDVHDRAIRAAVTPELGLVLLHLPVPHVPAIYDRRSGQITSAGNGGYEDNLALMDRMLGDLRKAMEAAGQWDPATVLVTTDHPLPSRWPAHPRIPFLLKLAGQKQGLAYPHPFNTVVSHDLVLASLRGELRTAADAAGWLDRERLRFPTELARQ